MDKVSKASLVARLESAIGACVGQDGFDILFYGWIKYHRFDNAYYQSLMRRSWLSLSEAQSFNAYAGYDLIGENYQL